MEGKLLTIILILMLDQFMQGITACQDTGEECGIANNFSFCCTGNTCANTHTGVFGGICEKNEGRTCSEEGENCGAFQGVCCDKLQCSKYTSGTCKSEAICQDIGEVCGIANDFSSCCSGSYCDNSETGALGGKCKAEGTFDGHLTCQLEGENCGGVFQGICCGKLVCSNIIKGGTCQNRKKPLCQDIGKKCGTGCCPGSVCARGKCEKEIICLGDGEDCGLLVSSGILHNCCDNHYCVDAYNRITNLQGTCMKEIPKPVCIHKGESCGPLMGKCCKELQCSTDPLLPTCESSGDKKSCKGIGEECDTSNSLSSCCLGSYCDDTDTNMLGGKCKDVLTVRPRSKKICREKGENCGGILGGCCDKLNCSTGNKFGGTCS